MFQVLFKYRLCHLLVNNICRFLRISQLLRTLNRAFPMETVRKTHQALWDLLTFTWAFFFPLFQV